MENAARFSLDYARQLDRDNPLKCFRNRFYSIPGVIYMDGNSLGLLSKDAEESILRVLNEWKTMGIGGWLGGQLPWFWFAEKMGALASRLIGAKPEEVVMTGTTTLNIHSLISSFYEPTPGRYRILADELNFPSDLYALKSQIRLKGYNPEEALILVRANNMGLIEEDSIIQQMTDDVAIAFFPSVQYRSGQLLDMEKITSEAHRRGIYAGFDCSHSVGAVPHFFDEWGVDFALWCSYKYLNAGPGAAAFIYVCQTHFSKEPRLAGWFGYLKNKQFEMLPDFIPAPHAGRWQISSPGILGTSPIEGSLKITLEAGIENIRNVSLHLTEYLVALIEERIIKQFEGFRIVTPLTPERRGGHIAIEHQEAHRITEALKARSIVPDLRPPNVIRIAPIALYNTFEEVWQVIESLFQVMKNKEFERFGSQRRLIS